MYEKDYQEYEDCGIYAGNLEEETKTLLEGPDPRGITYNTSILITICC